MGYSLWLENKKTGLMCERKKPEVNLGNMLCIGGSDLMEFNITYNYSHYYYEADGFEKDGIRTIYGKTGKQSLPLLRKLSAQIMKKYFNASKNRWKQTIRQKKVAVVNGEVCMIDDSKYQKEDIEELNQKAYETCAFEITSEVE